MLDQKGPGKGDATNDGDRQNGAKPPATGAAPKNSAPPTSPEVDAHYKSMLFMLTCMGFLWALESGVESGVGPCSFTTLTEKLDASVTEVTAAQVMAEVTKCAGSFVVAVFTTSAAVQVSLICAGGGVLCFGCLLCGLAQNVAMLGAGFFFIGLGMSFFSVLCAPVLEYYVVSRAHRHKIAFYLGVVYAGSSLGVAVAFGICGATIEIAWRWNYLAPMIAIVPVVVLLGMSDRRSAATRGALPLAELAEKELPEDDSSSSSDSDDGEGDRRPVGSSKSTGRAGSAVAVPPSSAAAAAAAPSAPKAGTAGTKTEEEAVAARAVHDDALAMAVLRLKPKVMPWWRLWLHTKLLLATPCYLWSMLFNAASAFYVTAYIVLLAVFLERQYGMSKGAVAGVLAALIPASAAGLILSGIFVRKYRIGLEGQLRLILVTSIAALPLAFGFFLPLEGFLVVLILAMLVVFAQIGPSRTVFPLMIDSAGLVEKLHVAIAEWEAAHGIEHHHHHHHHHHGSATSGATTTEDSKQMLRVRATSAAVPIEYADDDDDSPKGDDKRRRQPQGTPGKGGNEASSSGAPEVHPGVKSQADVVAREVLVAHSNAVANLFHRIGGSIPGPIVLAALTDHTSLSLPVAYCIVGLIGMLLAIVGSYFSWRENPQRTEPILPRTKDEREAVDAARRRRGGSAAIQYVDDADDGTKGKQGSPSGKPLSQIGGGGGGLLVLHSSDGDDDSVGPPAKPRRPSADDEDL